MARRSRCRLGACDSHPDFARCGGRCGQRISCSLKIGPDDLGDVLFERGSKYHRQLMAPAPLQSDAGGFPAVMSEPRVRLSDVNTSVQHSDQRIRDDSEIYETPLVSERRAGDCVGMTTK